jgi:Ca2+-binding EF-hand superfamily protein
MKIFNLLDKNKNSKIYKNDFIRTIETDFDSDLEKEEINSFFNNLDEDDNGFID